MARFAEDRWSQGVSELGEVAAGQVGGVARTTRRAPQLGRPAADPRRVALPHDLGGRCGEPLAVGWGLIPVIIKCQRRMKSNQARRKEKISQRRYIYAP